jgi:hypothetical protein
MGVIDKFFGDEDKIVFPIGQSDFFKHYIVFY